MKTKKIHFRSSSRAVALEPRLLFDGAGAVAAVDGMDDFDFDEQHNDGLVKDVHEAGNEQQSIVNDGDAIEIIDGDDSLHIPSSLGSRLGLDAEQENILAGTEEKTLLIIDSRVDNHELLLENVGSSVTVVVVGEGESGLDAISNALAGSNGYDAIHIISHGTPGSFTLGNDLIDSATLNQNSEQLQAWADYLNPGADILLYGCDVAQGEAGQSFIDQLAAITGADIAASINPTGNAEHGGDWVLESETGSIEAEVMTLGALQGVLDGSTSGQISKIEFTADDEDVTVGEDDEPTNILGSWKVTGTGQITVTVSGVTNGTLGHPDHGGSLTFTGSAEAVNAWLAKITYQYKQTDQSETGDTDTITLTFTTLDTNGQQNQSQNKTQQINIAAQNDAPVVDSDGKVIAQVDENGELSFGAPTNNESGLGFTHTLLGISDPDNTAKQVIIKLEEIPDPEHGQLILTKNGQDMILAAGSTLSVADLEHLKYVHNGKQVSPNDGSASTPNQTIKFTIDDGAGGRLEGQTVEIKLNPVNQPPTVSGSVTIVEGETDVSLGNGGSLTASRPDDTTTTIIGDRGKIGGVDPDDSNDQLSYKITSLPEHGTLKYDGVVLTAENIGNTEINDLSKLTYSYPQGEMQPHELSTPGQVSFKIQVTDQGGGAGVDKAKTSDPIEVILTILDNNDDPTLITEANLEQDYTVVKQAQSQSGWDSEYNFTDVTPPDHGFIITPDMLGVTDPDSFDNNLVFKVTGLSNEGENRSGYFTVNGFLLNPETSFTMQDVKDGKVAYHLRNTTAEERTDSFTFTVTDSATGLIFQNGQAYQRDGGIYGSDEPDAKLTEHTFSVKVPASTQGGEGDLPPLPKVAEEFEITTKPMEDVLESIGQGTSDETGKFLTNDMLNTKDGVNSPDKIVYRLETLPATGSLWLKVGNDQWKQLKQFDSFTQKDIDDENVIFKHDGGDEKFNDEFQFSVSNGDITTDALSTFQIKITPQNDTPTVEQNGAINLLEGGSLIITNKHINLSDADKLVDGAGDYANNNELHFVVTEIPKYGQLIWSDDSSDKIVYDPDNYGDASDPDDKRPTEAEVNNNNEKYISIKELKITNDDLNSKYLSYEHGGAEQFTDSFKIRPYDNQGVTGEKITDTNQKSEGEEATIKITIVPVNNAPIKAADIQLIENVEIYEGGEAYIYGSDQTKIPSDAPGTYGQLVFTDQDNDTDQIQYRVTKATEYGQLMLGGQVLGVGSIFTQADLDSGKIVYKHNGGQQHTDTFEYTVSDGDYTVNANYTEGSTATSDGNNEGKAVTPSTFTIKVKPSNDKPEFSSTRSNPVLIDGKNPEHNLIPEFQVKDIDLLPGENGEKDLITVIVRVVNSDGSVVDKNTTPYDLKITDINGLLDGSITDTSYGSYLQITGSINDVNNALKSLGVAFTGSDPDSKNYMLQVIVDDRLNATGDAYQNGGAGVTANGGDKNQKGKNDLEDIDDKVYDWANDKVNKDSSLNLNVAEVALWVSTENDAPQITAQPDPITAQEDVPYQITGLKFSDQESSTFGTSVDVTLTVNSGTLTAEGLPDGITIVSGDGTSSLKLRGSVDALNNYFDKTKTTAGAGVFYTTAADVNHDTNGDNDGDVTLTVTLSEGAANHNNPANGGSAIGGDTGSGSVAHPDVQTSIAITIDAINDAPVVTAPEAQLPIDSNDWIDAPGFTLSDVDADNGYADGETDGIIRVVVRLQDDKGNPFANSDAYKGISFRTDATAHGVTVIGEAGGAVTGQPLELYGTLAQIQAYLAEMQVKFDSTVSDGANLDGTLYLEVVMDDRIYEKDTAENWILKQEGGKYLANGGTLNQNGTDTPTEILGTELNVYSAAPDIVNINSARQELFISAINDPAEITAEDVTVDEGSSTLVLDTSNANFDIDDSDHNGSTGMVTTVTVTKGIISGVGAHSDLVTGVDTNTISITGATQDQINAILNSLTITLPGTNETEQADWNGQFEVTVVYNDKGNTGLRPGNLDNTKAGSDSNNPKVDGGDFDYADDTSNHLTTTRTITVTVNPVNDAPVDIGSGPVSMTPAIEDTDGSHAADGTPSGNQTVGELFISRYSDAKDNVDNSGAADSLTDGSDSDTFFGIAVVGNSAIADQGAWQWLDGGTWKDIPTDASDSNALILDASTQLRFKPAANFHGTPGELSVRLVESNTSNDTTSSTFDLNTDGGTAIDLTSLGGVGGTSLVGKDIIKLQTSVTNVNDRPTGANATLTSVPEDTKDPAGETVDNLFGLDYADATDNREAVAGGSDASTPFGGIAIVGNTANSDTEGVWQYQTTGGEWTAVGTPSDSSALILPTDAKLRFVPVENFNGTPPALDVRLADSTQTFASGVDLALDSTEANNATSTWSEKVQLGTSVTPLNDAPEFSHTPSNPTAVEGEGTNSTTEPVKLLNKDGTVSDLDLDGTAGLDSNIFGAGKVTVSLTDGIKGDTLNLDGLTAGTNGIASITGGTDDSDLVITFTEDATLAEVNAVLEAIQYQFKGDDPTRNQTGTPRTELGYTITLNDGNNNQGNGNTAGGPDSLDSEPVSGTISFTPDNDPPVATNDGNLILNSDTGTISGDVIKGEHKDTSKNTASGSGVTNGPDSDPDTPIKDLKISGIQKAGDTDVTTVTGEAETTIQGEHGTLTINTDGTYTYVVNPDDPAVYGLAEDATITDTFTYTLSDGGKTATADLVITIKGDTPPAAEISVKPNDNVGSTGADAWVSEQGLAGGSNKGHGHTTTGEFEVSVPSGLDKLTIEGEELTVPELKGVSEDNPLEIEHGSGVLKITGYEKIAGDGDVPQKIKLTYTYELTQRVDNTAEGEDEGVTESFELTATGKAGSPATGSLNVYIVDDEPEAQDDNGEVKAKETLAVPADKGVLSNDTSGADGWKHEGAVVGVQTGDTPTPHAGGVAAPLVGTYGTLTLNADGSYTYVASPATPGAPPVVTDVFTYTVRDADGDETTAKLTITVQNNQPPVIVENPTVTTPEDTEVNGNLVDSASDPDDEDTLTVTEIVVGGDTPVTVPGDGTPVEIDIPGKGTLIVYKTGDYTFTPTPDWHGYVPEITFTIDDGKGADNSTVEGKLNITVTPVQDAFDDTGSTHVNTPITTPVLDNDLFNDPDAKITATTPPANGTIVVNDDGTITYTPEPGFTGTDTYTYTVTSGGVTETATVTIEVTNQPPAPVNDAVSTPEDTPVDGNLLVNDSDPDRDPLTVTDITIGGVTTQVPTDGSSVTVVIPDVGSVTVDKDGNYSFTPLPDWNGEVPSIAYTVDDGTGSSNSSSTATLNITVTPVQDIQDDKTSTPAGNPVKVPVLDNDKFSDPDAKVTNVGTPDNGKVTINPDGTVTYTPNPGFSGEDSFTYTVTTQGGVTETATVTVTVFPEHTPAPQPVIPDSGGYTPVPSDQINGKSGNSITGSPVITDPSVFYEGERWNDVRRLPIPLHPVLYVNNEVANSQQQREQQELRTQGTPDLARPYASRLISLGSGLGQDQNLFVTHAIRAAQSTADELDSRASSRLSRTNLSADDLLPTAGLRHGVAGPMVADLAHLAAEQLQRAEPQEVAEESPADDLDTARVAQQAPAGAAPSFTEQLRSGDKRLPMAALNKTFLTN